MTVEHFHLSSFVPWKLTAKGPEQLMVGRRSFPFDFGSFWGGQLLQLCATFDDIENKVNLKTNSYKKKMKLIEFANSSNAMEMTIFQKP